MSKTLNLVLKGKWYDMIELGEKPEEYREIKPFWIKRFCYHFQNSKVKREQPLCDGDCIQCVGSDEIDGCAPYPFQYVRLYRGYTKKHILFRLDSIKVGIGNSKWGAPNRDVFILKLGERIK